MRGEWVRRVRTRTSTRERLLRAIPAAGAGIVLAFVVLRMAWDASGYFPPAYLRAGAVSLITASVLLAAVRPRFGLSTEALVGIAALVGLALWTGLSSLWSATPSAAIDLMQRDLAYIGMLTLGIIAAGSGRFSLHLVWGVLGVCVLICGAGLVARLFPDLIREPGSAFGSFRLAYPLTYWNALGCLAALAAVLAFGLAADPRTHWALRSTSGVASVLMTVTMYLSLSRGAWLALFIGLAALVLLSAHRGSLLLTGGIVGVAAAAAIARLQAYPALTDDPNADAGQEAAGHAFAGQLVTICLIVAGTLAFVGITRAAPELMRKVDRVARPVLLGGLGLLAAVFVVGYAARAADADGFAARQMIKAEDWVDRQWDEFMAPSGTPAAGGSARVTAGAQGSRSDLYRVALDEFADAPLAGDGAGSFQVRWLADRPIGETVANAHSLEVETLGELGIVGAALLLTFLAAVTTAVVRARLRPGGLSRSQSAAVGGAFTVWLVHSAVDWDWQMPAVTVPALVLACAVFPHGRGVRRRERPVSHELMEDVR